MTFKTGDKIRYNAESIAGFITQGETYTFHSYHQPELRGKRFLKVVEKLDSHPYHNQYSGDFVLAEAPVVGESDPTGRSAHEKGSKLDAGKVRPALVLGGFARALLRVSDVGTYGAMKYTDNGWQEVPKGVERYDDAGLRHWLKEKAGQENDPDTELEHAAHTAWNALARLDLLLREKEKASAVKA